MSRELWLLRHGQAEHNGNINDSDRRLTAKGEQEVKRVGQWLQQAHLCPDVLLTSPATRAYMTAHIIADALAWNEIKLQQDKRLYFEGMESIKTLLSELPASLARVLIVGHNPDFTELVVDLVGNDKLPAVEELMPTATLVRLQLPDDWRHLWVGCAEVLDRVLV